MKVSIFWFRRDLRLEDNTALYAALKSDFPVLPLFIFDNNILEDLSNEDPRFSFIYDTLKNINIKLNYTGSSILCLKGDTVKIWEELINSFDIHQVYINKDYEPYAIERDGKVKKLLDSNGIVMNEYKDQVIFEGDEIVKNDGKPYTVFTPYKNKWLSKFRGSELKVSNKLNLNNYYLSSFNFPSLSEIGFKKSLIRVKDYNLSRLDKYAFGRDFPCEDVTSNLGPHLRFGTVSIRQIISQLKDSDEVFLRELIWREFFMQILYHFPNVVFGNFKLKYDGIEWRNNESEFKKWCEGNTGYPFVDAGMRELNSSGYMHNRVRMVVASFLCKHLLIDWRWGEAYFAEKLLDYELSSNNGNWQWAASTGCDAVPYFRIFNPSEQLKKFDKNFLYVKKWIPEYDPKTYIEPIVEHKFARNRALEVYSKGLLSYK